MPGPSPFRGSLRSRLRVTNSGGPPRDAVRPRYAHDHARNRSASGNKKGGEAPKGSKWKVIQVVAENAADPNYKVTDKLIPYNG